MATTSIRERRGSAFTGKIWGRYIPVRYRYPSGSKAKPEKIHERSQDTRYSASIRRARHGGDGSSAGLGRLRLTVYPRLSGCSHRARNVGLANVASRSVNEISRGERQLVLLARALATSARTLRVAVRPRRILLGRAKSGIGTRPGKWSYFLVWLSGSSTFGLWGRPARSPRMDRPSGWSQSTTGAAQFSGEGCLAGSIRKFSTYRMASSSEGGSPNIERLPEMNPDLVVDYQ